MKHVISCVRYCLLAMTCCLVSSPAIADDLPAVAGDIWNSSLVLSAGLTKENHACSSPLLAQIQGGGNCGDYQTGLRFAYDHQYASTPSLGIEISYGDLGNATASGIYTAAGGGPAKWQLKAKGWAIDQTGTFHVGGGLSILGKVGLVRAGFAETFNSSVNGVPFSGSPVVNEEKTSLTFGVGIQYDFDRDIAVRAQFENFGFYSLYGGAPQVNLEMASAGLVLKF